MHHLQHLPTPSLSNLPPILVSIVTVGPVKVCYFGQYSGGPMSVASTYISASLTQPNDFYMANDDKFYRK